MKEIIFILMSQPQNPERKHLTQLTEKDATCWVFVKRGSLNRFENHIPKTGLASSSILIQAFRIPLMSEVGSGMAISIIPSLSKDSTYFNPETRPTNSVDRGSSKK